MKKTWTLDVDGASHTIELDHGFWSGKRTISVDGRVAHASRRLIDFGSNTPIEVGTHRINVIVMTNGVTFRYDIVVDGISEATGRPIAVVQSHLPWWGWLFAAACLAIPIFTLGGVFPVIIGAFGMLTVVSNATNASLTERTRVLRCLSVTIAAWAAVVLLILLFGTVLA